MNSSLFKSTKSKNLMIKNKAYEEKLDTINDEIYEDYYNIDLRSKVISF